MRIQLYGAQADELRPALAAQPALEVVDHGPDAIVCYGGDGTLLSAEREWPGVPKAPIRNSRRGNRCIGHPPEAVLARLAQDRLVRTAFLKLECIVGKAGDSDAKDCFVAMNEINVHMGRINSAVRFRLWLDEEPLAGGEEVLGDGFVVTTPFGSTAYFNQITRGIFHVGIGIAFKHTTEHTNHVIVPEDRMIRVEITRGPAILGYDNGPEYVPLEAGYEILVRRHAQPATILTWGPMSHPSDEF